MYFLFVLLFHLPFDVFDFLDCSFLFVGRLGRVVEYDVVGIFYDERIGILEKGFKIVAHFVGSYFAEGTIGEVNILHMTILAADHRGEAEGAGVNIVKINVANGLTTGVGAVGNVDLDRTQIDAVHGDIGEREILNERILASLVCEGLIAARGQGDGDTCARLAHGDAREDTVTDSAVIQPADTDAVGMAGEGAVGDGYLFAHLVFGK